jgi:hypothetical protein
MSSIAAARCRHIKVSGTQCGSPALRNKNFCFYHQQDHPLTVECYSEGEYATGEIALPVFEDAHSLQTVIRQVVQLVLQKRIERKTASLLLYALQIASSNLKRMELEKPQPEQVVIDLDTVSQTPMAAPRRDCARNFSQRAPNKWQSKSWRGQRLARRRPSARHNPGLLSPRTTNPESPSPKSPAKEAICNLND